MWDIHTLKVISNQVDVAFDIWAEAQRSHLEAVEQLYDAKYVLARLVDDAYRNGDVSGKNERERESVLRDLIPAAYQQVEDAERTARHTERALKDAEIVAEKVRLQVQIARCVIAVTGQ